ncbi:MAG: methyltransferase domain-containing protein [Actinomycetota bacterium]|jgi:2-polyprenyl-6-hydroxyphenyl methylase/3-demethylubiquinone-9 3-methyltransferase|nr:methyltransferase domain-containing protein [Euzebyaceae bacterium]MDQ3452842.1 methyltransferase domain-containing protein [Actinomycetota bacterium]
MSALAPPPLRNDPAQYDDLAAEWWRPGGAYAALRWLASARARLLPPPPHTDALLVDVACGGGLMAPHTRGYRHLGIDLSMASLQQARAHGLACVQGDATTLPLADEVADVVVAGEIFEHLSPQDLPAAVAEIVRVLRPGGLVLCDTINATWWARFTVITVGERLRGIAPKGCHDHRLFVPPQRLQEAFAHHGIPLAFQGLRFSWRDFFAFLASRSRQVRMLPTRSLAGVYQGYGRKAAM